MYISLIENKTKSYYRQIIDSTLSIAEDHVKESGSPLWISIVNQIKDIKENVVDTQSLTDWEDFYDRYSLGRIAIEYFEEDDEMYQRLCDIFGGAVHYNELPEE